jgi:signal transduction histidine kinase
MKDLISQLLFFSRLEQGREPLQIVASDLSQLVTQICEEQAALDNRGITLTQNIAPHITAPADCRLFGRVVSNLLSNAYKYSNSNGHITVNLYEKDGNAILQVSDDGIGISAEHLPFIFDRFYQADASRTSDNSIDAGAGLGLSMVREIVQMHHGTVNAESIPGEGSIFTVTIPAYF